MTRTNTQSFWLPDQQADAPDFWLGSDVASLPVGLGALPGAADLVASDPPLATSGNTVLPTGYGGGKSGGSSGTLSGSGTIGGTGTITAGGLATVAQPGATIALSSLFTIPAASSNPAYLVLSGLDRNEYTAGISANAMGTLVGNGVSQHFANQGGDAYSVSVVFSYNSSNGRYYNPNYGYFDQLSFVASTNGNDNVNLALYTTNNLVAANSTAADTYALIQDTANFQFVGSAAIITESGFTGAAPAQATPNSICAVAQSFVGADWNLNGCWVLASDIAAEAGAALSVNTALVGVPGAASGEWVVAYDGPVSANANWESSVTAGEMVVFETTSGTGHITTVVSGTGSTAKLIDNAEFQNAGGTITNAANDGSSSDIVLAAAHAASAEFNGVDDRQVVVYELDTPVVSATGSINVSLGGNLALGSLLTASNPLAGQGVTEWQLYVLNSADELVSGGTVDATANSAATALSVASLANVDLLGSLAAGTDTLDVRAFNGTYWGDWQSLATDVVPDVAADFSADGMSDLLWQGSAGLQVTLMDGLASAGTTLAGDPTASLHMVATADFTGGSQADILLQDNSGAVDLWLMTGATLAQQVMVANPGSTWHAIGVGDFTGNGATDILFQNDGGQVADWAVSGGSLAGGAVIGDPGTFWHAVGAGDFAGTGTSDILFQADDGTVAEWQMHAGTLQQGAIIADPGNFWRVAATGDLGGTGTTDIVLQGEDGSVAVWMMNGATIAQAAVLANPGTAWHVMGTGDTTGNGQDDILLQNDNGAAAIWQLSGTTLASSTIVANLGTAPDLLGLGGLQFINASQATGTLSAGIAPVEFEFPSSQAGRLTLAGFNPMQDVIALPAASFASYAAVQAETATMAGGAGLVLTLDGASALLLPGVSALSARNFILS